MKPLKNMAASAHQKLLNTAKQENRPFNEIVQYYALERWLYEPAFIVVGKLRGALKIGAGEILNQHLGFHSEEIAAALRLGFRSIRACALTAPCRWAISNAILCRELS